MVFAFWVIFYTYSGYRKGLWVGLLSLAGFLVAYLATIVWSAPVASWLEARGWSVVSAYLTGFVGVYGVVQLSVSELPRYIFRAQLKKKGHKPVPGALLGAVSGICSGLLLVWVYSMIQAAISVNRDTPITAAKVSALEIVAGKAVAEASRVGAQFSGASTIQANVVAEFMAEPQQSLRNIRRLGQSSELKAFISSSDSQYYMQSNNLDGLVESPAFQRLINLPEVAEIRSLAYEQVRAENPRASLREGDELIAGQMSQAWRRMRAMRDDPSVREVLSDPNIKRLLDKRDIAALLNNKKFQKLILMITDGRVAASESVSVPEESEGSVERNQSGIQELSMPPDTPNSAPVEVYKWRDSNGRVRFSNQRPPNQDVEAIQYGG